MHADDAYARLEMDEQRAGRTRFLFFEFGIPVEIVHPTFVQIVGRKETAVAVKLEHGWPVGRPMRPHAGGFEGQAAFLQVARGARC